MRKYNIFGVFFKVIIYKYLVNSLRMNVGSRDRNSIYLFIFYGVFIEVLIEYVLCFVGSERLICFYVINYFRVEFSFIDVRLVVE